MAREDIKTCIKNGLERNQPIQDVKDSLINAGYSPKDVNEAINELKDFIPTQNKMVPKPSFIPQLPKSGN